MKTQKYFTSIIFMLSLIVMFMFFMSCKKSSNSVSSEKAPTVISTSPANGDTGISVSTIIMATFSTAMNPSTISGTTFTLNDNNLNSVDGSVIYGNSVVTFTPSANLTKGTTYTATITTGVKDTAGTALASNYSWSFKTVSGSSSTPGGFTGNFLAWTGSGDASHSFELVRINGQTGAVTNIGGDDYFRDMEYGPDGTLYGIGSSLVIINPADGSTTLIGSIHHGSESDILMAGGGFAPNGKLYVRANMTDSIFTLDVTNGALTYVGLPTALIEDIEFASDGTFYAAFAQLFTLNPANAATLTTIGRMGVYIGSMSYGSSGILYGMDYNPSTTLYSINTATAGCTTVVPVQSAAISCIVAERGAAVGGDIRLPKSRPAHHYTESQLRSMEAQAKLDYLRHINSVR